MPVLLLLLLLTCTTVQADVIRKQKSVEGEYDWKIEVKRSDKPKKIQGYFCHNVCVDASGATMRILSKKSGLPLTPGTARMCREQEKLLPFIKAI